MEKIFDYIILEKIYETSKSVVYRGKKEGQEQTNIIKVLISNYPTLSEIARFKQECEIIKSLDIDGIVKIYEMVEQDNKFALVQEDFNGISLKDYLKNNKIDIKTFLKIAIKISEIIGIIHRKNIIHKDIKPHNIIINLEDDLIKITDFGIAEELTHKNKELYNPDVIEGTLPYMSPEQTGRINRPVDYRTDLYSLGITFYEMLTGELPFKSNDPIEFVHSHIAKMPVSPKEINPSIPKVISDIVLKLISKNSEERYQNSFGLEFDLKECLMQLEEKNQIDDFELAKNDISMKFNMPQNIFGRDEEIKTLLSAFEKVSSSDGTATEIMMVCGQPGIGKSMLVNEIHKPIVAKRGYFICGKYDQFRRDVPYSSIIQAFQGLINQILVESDEKIELWREKILCALGNNGKIITDVIPNVRLIIGEQPEVPVLGPEQSQNRFNLVFKNFVSVFTSAEHPIALFLDDLQWADYASLMLIKTIIAEADIKHFFFIGAYRDNEVSMSHPLMIMLEEIKKQGINIDTIQIASLKVDSVNQLVANFLRCNEKESLELAEIIYKKTNGNPFFVNQFLKTLYEEHLIELNQTSGWVWDIAKINTLQVTDNVVQMMAEKINKLPKDTQEILKICACIGNRFDLETLSTVVNKTIDETLAALTLAVQEGLICLCVDLYKFYHDRIHEAAYSLIPDEEKAKKHYAIGNLTLSNTPEADLIDKILYIVDQLNAGKSEINSEEEKYKLAKLNLLAGTKAKSSTAYLSALNYLRIGIDSVGDECWEKDYQLARLLHEEAAEAAFLSTDFDEMEKFSEVVIKRAKTATDKVKIYVIKMNLCMAQNQPSKGVEAGYEILGLLGIKMPKKASGIKLLSEIIKVKKMLKGKKPEDIINLPEMTDPYYLSVIKIISLLLTAAYYSAPKLLALIDLEAVKIIIKHGNTFCSPYIFSTYGVLLFRIGKIDQSYEFGKIGMALLEKMDVKDQKAKTIMTVNTFIRHWKEHNRNTLPHFELGYKSGLEIGDFVFSSIDIQCLVFHSLFAGLELTSLNNDIIKYEELVGKLKQKSQLIMIQIYHQTLLNLIEEVEDPCCLAGRVYDENKMLSVHLEMGDKPGYISSCFQKVMLCYLFYDYERAVETANKALKDMNAIEGTIKFPEFFLYYSLSLLGLYDKVNNKKQKRSFLSIVAKNQKKMKKWAFHAPMNHEYKYLLVEAELARVNGNELKAMELYDSAISSAHEYENLNGEALAYEVAGKFYYNKDKEIIAQTYLSGAYNAYYRWGAASKVKDLEKRYRNLVSRQPINTLVDISNETIGHTNTIASELLDLKTVMKLLQLLSSEIDLARLMKSFLNILIKNVGAQNGFIILQKEDKNLYIEAEYTSNKEIEILTSERIDNSEKLSKTIVNYVNKTNEQVVLNNALYEGMFTNDPYIVNKKVKSLLCAPIIHKKKASGVIYLENNLMTYAFMPERLELVKILLSQAAISMENARLYSMATTDMMTGLVNNTHFNNILEKHIKEFHEGKDNLALLMLDIDHFKEFNDNYGHQAGDIIVKSVAQVIKSTCCSIGTCARYGGEEFAVILPSNDLNEAYEIAEEIREGIANIKINYNDNELRVTISIGVASIPENKLPGITKEELIKAADTALYKSKDAGRNKVTIYSE
ncbi:MAG: diguanylate cyclase [Ignavibacteriales bacterium]